MGDRRILESWKAIAGYLGHDAKTCRRWEQELGLPVHRLEDSPRAHVFAYADELDRWREEKLEAERGRAEAARGFGRYRLLLRRLRKPWIGIPAMLALAGVAVSAVWFFDHESKVRWANNVAIPEIERLMTVTEWNKMADLAFRAERYIPKDPKLARLITQVTAVLSLKTEPAGADIYLSDYSYPGENWNHVGKSPISDFRLSQGYYVPNFAPRVKIPVLMQNGRYDCQYPLETNVKRLFGLLGTPEKDKHLLLYETGHCIWAVNEYRKDMLDFLNKYLGPVE